MLINKGHLMHIIQEGLAKLIIRLYQIIIQHFEHFICSFWGGEDGTLISRSMAQ